MGAHAARPHRRHRPTVARLAATTLTVAVTGTLGAGTALAHDEWGDDGGPGSHGSHDEHSRRNGHDAGRWAAEQARDRVRDVLADLGLPSNDSDSDSGSGSDSGESDGPGSGHDGDEHAASSTGTPAPEPSRPSSGPRTTTQPIAAGTDTGPTSDVPPAGETETFPIR